jgi:hypothetical protein
MMTLLLTALLAWRIAALVPVPTPLGLSLVPDLPGITNIVSWSFTPDVSKMTYPERESYFGGIAQGPGGHDERK